MTEIETLQKMTGSDVKVIFDVGAGSGGSFSVPALAAFPSATVYAFEPDESEIARGGLAELARVEPRLELFKLGILDEAGRGQFNLLSDRATNSFLRPTARFVKDHGLALEGTVEVDVMTLDEFCEENGIPGIDILNIDVQGAELLVLKGAERLLTEGKAGTVLVELAFYPFYEGQCGHGEVIDYLASFGYRLRRLFPFVEFGQPAFADGVFTRS